MKMAIFFGDELNNHWRYFTVYFQSMLAFPFCLQNAKQIFQLEFFCSGGVHNCFFAQPQVSCAPEYFIFGSVIQNGY
jgi:hypothetical protein